MPSAGGNEKITKHLTRSMLSAALIDLTKPTYQNRDPKASLLAMRKYLTDKFGLVINFDFERRLKKYLKEGTEVGCLIRVKLSYRFADEAREILDKVLQNPPQNG